MIVNRSNQRQIPNQRESHLPHNINLPKLIRMASLKPLNRLYGRKAYPIQMMLDQNRPNRIFMYQKLEPIPDKTSRAMFPLKLALNNPPLILFI
jgi:tyrosyl-tRNA synthetase